MPVRSLNAWRVDDADRCIGRHGDPLRNTDWPADATLLESYLEPTVIDFTERTSSIEGDLRVGPIDLVVHDRRITAGILTAKRPITWLGTRTPTAVGYTALAASVLKDDMTITVASIVELGSFPRVLYIDEEAILCSGAVGAVITVTTRGYYGTASRAHLVDLTSSSTPIVFKDFPTFYGRKAVVWIISTRMSPSRSTAVTSRIT